MVKSIHGDSRALWLCALGLVILSLLSGCAGARKAREAELEQIVSWLPGNYDNTAQVELTHNWEPEPYGGGRNFGHLAYAVDDIYATCERLQQHGVTINRPPRDGRMAFVRSPDNISIELLQKDGALPPREPWASMANTGVW